MTEEELVDLVKTGDTYAWDALIKSHKRKVYNKCRSMLKNQNDAEDLTQEVFMRVFRKVKYFRGDSSLSSWIYRITINTCPTNYLGVEEVIYKGETDPHGIFRYVRVVSPEEVKKLRGEIDNELLPE